MKASGLIVGANGKGGSGTCVELADGSPALLTARHVVIECIRNTGRVAIAAFDGKCDEPALIHMDSSQAGDAALLVFKHFPRAAKALPFAEWTRTRTDLVVGQQVVACGFPAALKNVSGRSVTSTFAYVGDRLISVSPDRVVSRINETLDNIPPTLEGFSGGGLFSLDGQFIGIAVEERRRSPPDHGEIHTILPSAFVELFTPFSIPFDAPPGLFKVENRSVAIDLLRPDGSGVLATVGSLAQCMWSTTSPNHAHGRLGRLRSLELIIPSVDTHYPININASFTWFSDTEDERLRAIQEEFRFLLLRLRWLISDSPNDDAMTIRILPPT